MTNKSIVKAVKEFAAQSYPHEACGFVIKKGTRSVAIQVPNESPHPQTQFLINPESWDVAAEQGEILAVWHTHVDMSEQPSEADKYGCNLTELPWLIMAIRKTASGEFVYSDFQSITPHDRELPYEGRPYVYGVFDCWSLVVDYQKRELGIEHNNDYPRLFEFWKNGNSFFSNSWQRENLVMVKDGTYQKGDILMFQTDSSGEPNHIGVYVGDGKFLHHVADRPSRIDIYGGYWLKHTTLHLRHISKC